MLRLRRRNNFFTQPAGECEQPGPPCDRRENEDLRQEVRELRLKYAASTAYIHRKINQLLTVMGTAPLRDEELDDATLIELDPIGIVSDAFEQVLRHLKETNDHLKIAHDEIAAIFDSVGAGILVVDRDRRVLASNRMMEEHFGIERVSAAGIRCYEAICRKCPDPDCPILVAISTGKSAKREMDLEGRHYDVVSTPIGDKNGVISRFVIIFMDMTGYKQVEEELKRAFAELEAFTYSVSHDLRSPIRSLQGFSYLLFKNYSDKLDSQGKKYLDFIATGAVKMDQIIDNLLSLSRVGRQDLRREIIDLSKIAELAAAELSGLQVRCPVAIDIMQGITGYADPRLIEVALSNLIGNAFKFTSKKTNARIEFGSFEQEGRTVFYVKDNGAGFDQALADKLFLPFQRLHSDHEFEGTGIGLAIVERVIRRHGGKIWAEGKKDEGATFFFTLR